MNFGLDFDRNLYLINSKEAKIQPNFWSGFFWSGLFICLAVPNKRRRRVGDRDR